MIQIAPLPAVRYDKRGCVLLIDMHEGAGNIAHDISGEGNDGTLSKANGVLPQWVTGRIGYGLSFDGVGAYLDCGNDLSLNLTDAITLEAWVKTYNNTLPNQIIVDKRKNLNEGNYELDIKLGYISLVFYNAGWYVFLDNTTQLANNAFYHVVFTYDRVNLRLYINGSNVKTWNETTAMVADMSNLTIGRRNYRPDRYFYGLIDEVRIYNRVLTIHEIKMHYIARA